MIGVLEVLEYIERVRQTFGEDYLEKSASRDRSVQYKKVILRLQTCSYKVSDRATSWAIECPGGDVGGDNVWYYGYGQAEEACINLCVYIEGAVWAIKG